VSDTTTCYTDSETGMFSRQHVSRVLAEGQRSRKWSRVGQKWGERWVGIAENDLAKVETATVSR